jgi:hypothetical protein
VSDVRVAHGLLGRAIVVVELSTQQIEPILEQKHSIVHEVAWASLDQQDLLIGQILCEARCDNAAGGAAANDDEVILRI